MANQPNYPASITPSTPEPPPSRRPDPKLTPPPPIFSPPPPTTQPPSQIHSPPIKSSQLPLPTNGIRTGSPLPHLSTPPGPPVFSSPVQPAAGPFRTSPATPQPVAYSAVASSPPSGFSDGGNEVQRQVASEGDDVSGISDAPNVLLSARKVLKQKKLMNTPSLGFGALVSPGRELLHGPQTIHRDPHRCHNCGAYANLFCHILLGSGQWQCVICRHLNASHGEYISPSLDLLRHSLPELSFPLVDFVQSSSSRFLPLPPDSSRLSPPTLLVIDDSLHEINLQHLQSSLHAFVDSLSATTRIGIITYGKTVSVYDLSENAIASADLLPGRVSPSQDALKQLVYGTGVYLSPIHAALPVAHSIFSSLRPFKENFPEGSRDRAMGAAIEVALAVIQGPSNELSKKHAAFRIIVCAGGPCTYGPGSVPHSFSHPNYPHMEKTAIKFMENLGKEAHKRNTVIDVLCAGTCPVRVPILQPLAKSSGGVLVLHDDFGEAFGVNLQRASTRAAGSHGLMEIRCSDDVAVTQVIGPGEEAVTDNNENFKNDNSLAIQMLSVEETQCFAVSIETRANIKSDFVYLQFGILFSSLYQADITRVITVRLPTVDSVQSYLESVNDEVAAVLIAKRSLLRAKNANDVYDVRKTIDERIKDMSAKFGAQVAKTKTNRFPKELGSLGEVLFHLRRGPLLGSIVGHEDERSVLRDIFLNASFELSVRMVAPRCLMHREGGTFEELPAHDLVMQSDAAVVLDHGTDVFIWLGAELAAQEGRSAAALAACRTLAEELTEMRFPAPRILAFKEGSSQARYFVSRLIPAHKDPPYEQEARFPQLRTLSTEQRTKLKSSFIHFDEPSFCEWMRSLKVLAPEPS